jgi:hypothetical protein
MMSRPRALLLVPLFAAVVLVACSPEPQRYDDLSSLAEAVTAAGVPCDRIDPGARSQLVSDTGTCATSGVTLYLFDRARDLDDWKKVATRVGPAVIGPNWAATGDADAFAGFSDELGGEIVSPSD